MSIEQRNDLTSHLFPSTKEYLSFFCISNLHRYGQLDNFLVIYFFVKGTFIGTCFPSDQMLLLTTSTLKLKFTVRSQTITIFNIINTIFEIDSICWFA